MSRVFFAWELGGGYGHLGPFRPIAELLMSRGHQVTIAAREVERANIVFGPTGAAVVQAPLCTKTYSGLEEPPLNYAEILMRYGYLDAPVLGGLVRAWRDLILLARPDVLVADHAPTALLAARDMRIAKLATGAPFTIPPRTSPTPNMRPWLSVPEERLASSDRTVLATVNASLPQGTAKLGTVPEIFEGAELLMSGVAELDPYAPRQGGSYLGLHAGSVGKLAPQWPQGEGSRIFAYLNIEYKHLEAAVGALAGSGARCVVFIAGVSPALREKHGNERLVFSDGLLDIDRTLSEADLCVCHGNFGTVTGSLRSGKPMVVLPMDLEKFLTAAALQKRNLAYYVHPDVPSPDFIGAIRMALSDQGLTDTARQFAARHRQPSVDTIVRRAADCIESLARTGSMGE